VDKVYAHAATASGPEAWLAIYGFSVQIYCDFSGYTDMAIGLAMLLGIRLPNNFSRPYAASSIIDFWRRWHITLSRFLRDYLYIPLGGNRKGPARRHVNLFATMLLGGLWHGAGWTFVIWGGLHGVYLIVNHAWQGIRGRLGFTGVSPVGRVAARALTFVVVVVAWVFFRAQSFGAAATMLNSMFLRNGLSLPASFAAKLGASHPLASMVEVKADGMLPNGLVSGHVPLAWLIGLALVSWFAPNTQELLARYRPALGFPAPDARGERYRWLEWRPNYAWSVVVGLLAAAAIANLWIGDNAQFIYFQF
jgi:D-alanyl-lipoteichoic acid acyltransferase DltB (MBOAT superfamily)